MSEPDLIFQVLDGFQPQTAQNAELLSFWKDLRGPDPVPLWRSFEPLQITDQLRHCAILVFESENDVKVRLFGNRLVSRLGMDLTGGNLLDIHREDQLPRIKERIRLAQTRPAVLCSTVTSSSSMGVPLVAETMMFPFASDAGPINRGLLSFAELEPTDPGKPVFRGQLDGTNFLKNIVLDV